MSKSSFNFTQAVKRAIETEEIRISTIVDEILQNAIQGLRNKEILLSKEMMSEVFFIQTDCDFSDYYENYYDEDCEEDVDEYEDCNGDVILVAIRNPYASLDYDDPFMEIYTHECDSAMEASILLNEIRKKMISEELETKNYFCRGALKDGKSFVVRIED